MKSALRAAAIAAALTLSAPALAAESIITMPDGWKVHVKTTPSGSIATDFTPEGRKSQVLRYPAYKGEDRHQALLMILTPPGATIERVK